MPGLPRNGYEFNVKDQPALAGERYWLQEKLRGVINTVQAGINIDVTLPIDTLIAFVRH